MYSKNSNVLRHLGCECLNLSQKTIGHPRKTRLYVLNCLLNQKLQITCRILITLHSIDAEKEKRLKFLMHCLTSHVFMKKLYKNNVKYGPTGHDALFFWVPLL